jgi:hypothetical protein
MPRFLLALAAAAPLFAVYAYRRPLSFRETLIPVGLTPLALAAAARLFAVYASPKPLSFRDLQILVGPTPGLPK